MKFNTCRLSFLSLKKFNRKFTTDHIELEIEEEMLNERASSNEVIKIVPSRQRLQINFYNVSREVIWLENYLVKSSCSFNNQIPRGMLVECRANVRTFDGERPVNAVNAHVLENKIYYGHKADESDFLFDPDIPFIRSIPTYRIATKESFVSFYKIKILHAKLRKNIKGEKKGRMSNRFD